MGLLFTPFYSPTLKHRKLARFLNRLWILIQVLFYLFVVVYHTFSFSYYGGVLHIDFWPQTWWVYVIIFAGMPLILSFINIRMVRPLWELIILFRLGSGNEDEIVANEYLDRQEIIERNARRKSLKNKIYGFLEKKIEDKKYVDLSEKKKKELEAKNTVSRSVDPTKVSPIKRKTAEG